MLLHDIDAILCDIGGVLYVGDTPIEGAVETIQKIKERYPIRFMTNTTQTTSESVVRKLMNMGFPIEPHEVITALDITKRYLQAHQSSAVFLLTPEAEAFFSSLEGLPQNYVVVGDAQENFTYANLNHAFRQLQKGAKLIAVAKNRYFKESDGELSLDTGAFVSTLEYATGQEAIIIGKPSRDFYCLACESLGINPSRIIMIGDDIESDILGAQQAGLKTIQVKTGKFSEKDLKKGIVPDQIIDSIADLD